MYFNIGILFKNITEDMKCLKTLVVDFDINKRNNYEGMQWTFDFTFQGDLIQIIKEISPADRRGMKIENDPIVPYHSHEIQISFG